ncbi:hypothetical protein BDP27DRAFT_1418399 [Rhodocollybia butyracea]|uniref:Uncharacterized protein n=1 Tax=Rhodocollybia butyracea TaxID=206335 RepID=A0A9P5Q160_9AGAR|nr:hypothetical protein BDP27DRAFT_1418399 [Rhodocollybia butyracea]
MTPEEVIQLSDLGLALFQDFVYVILFLSLFGVYCLAFCISLYIYWQKSTVTGAKKVMVCVLISTFVLMLLLLVSGVAPVPGLAKYDLVMTLPGGIMEQIAAAEAESHIIVFDSIYNWLINIIVFVTDAVIAWRAWAMWIDNTKVKLTLLLLMLANICVSLADGVANSDGSSQFNQNNTITLDWVNFILSFSVNMIATCLISFRAWLYHKSTKSIFITGKWTKGERILLLLVESGAIYAVLQLLVIITTALTVRAPSSGPIAFTSTLTIQLYIAAALPFSSWFTHKTPMSKLSILQKFPRSVNNLSHSKQAQSQQVPVSLSGPEGNPSDVAFEINSV